MKTFSRAQLTSLLATVVDYGMTIFVKHLLPELTLVAVACGALCGAIANFLANRYWTFESTGPSLGAQAIKYFFVSAGSLALNVSIVYLLIHYGHLYYLLAKVISGLFVGLAYNYPLHKFFVYAVAREKIEAKF